MKKPTGWKGESRRHSLARKRIKTARGESPKNHLKPISNQDIVNQVKELMLKEGIDPEYASPNFVSEFAYNRGISLTSEEVVEISDTYEVSPLTEKRKNQIMKDFFGYSFSDIGYDYNKLTDREKKILSRSEFEQLKKEFMQLKASGWHQKLRSVYGSKEEWEAYAEMYGLHKKLGYDTPEDAWADNPHIKGGTDPAEYGLYKSKKQKAPKPYIPKPQMIIDGEEYVYTNTFDSTSRNRVEEYARLLGRKNYTYKIIESPQGYLLYRSKRRND